MFRFHRGIVWFSCVVTACVLLLAQGCGNKQTNPATEASQEPTASDAGNNNNAPDAAVEQAPEQAAEVIAEADTVEKVADFPPNPQESYPPIEGGVVLEDKNPDPNVVEVYLEAKPLQVQLTEKISAQMYAYNGTLPGPIIKARVGDKVIIHFTNNLPEPTTVHWHGLRIPDTMDGSPRIQNPVPGKGGKFTYSFVVKDAGTYWYHPHVRSYEQVEKGLYGMLIVEEKEVTDFKRQRALILDDILLTDSGLAGFLRSHMEFMHGRTGNYLFINGKMDGIKVEAEAGTVERWRVVNVANARTMYLQAKNLKIRVIGTDGGLLPTPYTPTGMIEIAVGQRYDLEVTYTKPGDAILEIVVPTQTGQRAIPVAEISVKGDEPTGTIEPPTYPKIEPLPTRKVDRNESIVISAVEDKTRPSGIAWQMNGISYGSKPLFTFTKDQTVQITLRNTAGPEHPFHLHGQFFEILQRDGKPANEPGLKDTVLVHGMETVVIRAYMDNPGRWMAHCHILEHAAIGMMSEIIVKLPSVSP